MKLDKLTYDGRREMEDGRMRRKTEDERWEMGDGRWEEEGRREA